MRLGSTHTNNGNGNGRRFIASAEGLMSRQLSNQSRERHRIANLYFSSNDKPEWHNPCGGFYVPNGEQVTKKPPELDLLRSVSNYLF